MSSDDRLPLARAALIAMYGIAGMRVDLAHASPLWLPELRPIALDQVLNRLATLKPGVLCVPFNSGRDISIGAWGDRAFSDFKEDTLDLMRGDLAERSRPKQLSDYIVLVRSSQGGDEAELTWAQYEQWHREFDFVAPSIHIKAQHPRGDEVPRLIVTVSPPDKEGWITGTFL